mmetsp:Transcript_48944/g.116522  ORF Transcript_48944/g.116522 Transcript_48944/m.116522 type:complete len:219 (+) Transcript_48944:3640-4296(+)
MSRMMLVVSDFPSPLFPSSAKLNGFLGSRSVSPAALAASLIAFWWYGRCSRSSLSDAAPLRFARCTRTESQSGAPWNARFFGSHSPPPWKHLATARSSAPSSSRSTAIRAGLYESSSSPSMMAATFPIPAKMAFLRAEERDATPADGPSKWCAHGTSSLTTPHFSCSWVVKAIAFSRGVSLPSMVKAIPSSSESDSVSSSTTDRCAAAPAAETPRGGV